MVFSSISIQSSFSNIQTLISFYSNPSPTTRRCISSGAGSTPPEFPAVNAYEILGVPETSSFADIKASFRKLAKETHPDLLAADADSDSTSSHRFIQILAAYEILSDSERRAHYDRYLLSQRNKAIRKEYRKDSTLYSYKSRLGLYSDKEMEVVEWLKWYRSAVNDIVATRKVAMGNGYFDVLEADFYSAIHTAYYGPEIDSMELLPDRFEAEERSVFDTPEVLHLVSGRDLFGMVCLASNDSNHKNTELLSFNCDQKLSSLASVGLGICRSVENASTFVNSNVGNDVSMHYRDRESADNQGTDTYKDLELHLCGRVVAVATRIPPKSSSDRIENEDAQDKIHVFLSSEVESTHCGIGVSEDLFVDGGVRSRTPLGTITGLGTSPEEGSCFVYDRSGSKTHVIMKHRTLMVKHLHWYAVGDEVSVCECRCCRAQLPPSKFWLFEPRCGMHDIGGWYVETFGRDKKGQTAPSQRYWDGLDGSEQYDKRLHPAMYLLALAYRTLDIENAKRRKQTIRTIVEGQLFRILNWCKKLV